MMERAYYIVRPSQALDALEVQARRIEGQRSEIFKALKQVALATGCNPTTCLIERNACVGLLFDRGKPPELICKWKKVGNDTYWPRKSKAGRAIEAVFAFARPADLEDVLPAEVEFCVNLGDKFIVTGTYDEMRADEPAFVLSFPSGALDRIRPSRFQLLVDEAAAGSESCGGEGTRHGQGEEKNA